MIKCVKSISNKPFFSSMRQGPTSINPLSSPAEAAPAVLLPEDNVCILGIISMTMVQFAVNRKGDPRAFLSF